MLRCAGPLQTLLEPITPLLSILTLDSDSCQPADMLQLLVDSNIALVKGMAEDLQWKPPSSQQTAWAAVLDILQRPEVRSSGVQQIASGIKATVREQQGTSSKYVENVELVNFYVKHNEGIPQDLRELSSARVRCST